MFWPHAKMEANTEQYKGRDSSEYEHDSYGKRWPLCYGTCAGGKCKLDKSKPGCCYSTRGKHSYGYRQDVTSAGEVASTEYARESLLCWGGEEQY